MSSSERTAAGTRLHERRGEPSNQPGALSPTTLAVASVASVVSAIVVSHVWGPGTLYGAAATPIIFAIVSETLKRPRKVTRHVIETARSRHTRAFDPIEEGRRGLREGALVGDAPAVGGARPPRSAHRAGGRLSTRRRLVIALATGVLAFAIGAVVLTGSELVFGKAAVGGVSSRTTLFGGAPAKKTSSGSSGSQSEQTQKETTTTTTTGQGSTSTSVSPGTTSTSTSTSTAPTTTTPSTGGTTSPSPTAPAPQGVAPPGTTSTPSQSPAPPAQTTPTPTAP